MKRTVRVAALLLGLLSCVAQAESWVDDRAIQSIESITLLPIVLPAEVEFKNQEKAVSKARKELARQLALKGYVLDTPRNWVRAADWNYETMKDMTPAEIAQLAPESADHFAIGILDSVASSGNVVYSKANVGVSARIINQESGKVVWSNSESRRTSENAWHMGAIVMAFTDDEIQALYAAFVELFKELPEKEY